MQIHKTQSSTWHDILNNPGLLRMQAHINGEWVNAESGETLTVTNPADNSVLGTVPLLSSNDTRRAIEAAQAAFSNWRSKLAKERAAILRKWYELIMENQEDLAVLMTTEQGKPLVESHGEVAYAASFIEWFAEEGKRIYGDTIPQHQADKRILVIKEPIGVCAAITPWNFPAAMITRKVGPALAAGCPVIVKPASSTPYSALALAELGQQAGLPDGVLNVVTGRASVIGSELTSNPIVRKLSFTGSTKTGSKLMEQCSGTVKKLSLELGGNAPFIVFDDADMEAAVAGALASKYRNSGQTCVCANRLLVQDNIYDEFSEQFSQAVNKQLKVGNGLDEDTSQGPLIDMTAVENVESHIEDAVSKGAIITTGGKRHKLGGSFFEPTVLKDVTTDMRVAREETFGPLAPLFRFATEDDAIVMANNTEYGLAAYFYSRDLGRTWRVSEGLEYGIIGINTGIISTEVAPFGGMKSSGIGREGSKYGIDDYLEIKYVCIGGV